jgi:hypothetical protein
MTEPAAGWSVSRNRHTNEALISPGSAGVPNIYLASPVPDEAVVYLVVGSDGKPGYRAAERGSGLQVTCPQLSVVVRYQPSDNGPQTDKSSTSVNVRPGDKTAALHPLVSS